MENAHSAPNDVKIESLFDFYRFPSGWRQQALLCAYFPLGVVLAILRLFIGLHVLILSVILRHSVAGRAILRIMSLILGVVVIEEGEHRTSCVIVSNHVSRFDEVAIALTRACVLPTKWEIPVLLQRLVGVVSFGVRDGRDNFIKNAKRYCSGETASTQPLVSFPEGATTNGRTGFLKFNSWPFALDASVQPLVIRLIRPDFANVAPATIGSGWFADTFWFLCVPFTIFRLKWLPEVKIGRAETPELFARRVESMMADVAKVKSTGFTSHDAYEFYKRHSLDPAGCCRTPHPYDSLAARVKEIMPQVPMSAIISDLERTNGSVDDTIANFLEGRVVYTPEQATTPSTQKVLPKVSISDPSAWRELFEIRKQDMLETQRKKYLERKRCNLRSNKE